MTQQLEDKVQQQNHTSKELEIMLRRQKVWALHTQGFAQNNIAKKLDVSSKTISRDFQDLKKEAIEWMENLPEGEVQMHHKKSIEAVDQVLNKLWLLYENTKDEGMKLRILNTIASKSKMHSEMINKKSIFEMRRSIRYELRNKEINNKQNLDNS